MVHVSGTMMQISAAVCMLLFGLSAVWNGCVICGRKKHKSPIGGKEWVMRAERIGRVSKTAVHTLMKKKQMQNEMKCNPGRYTVGNGIRDEIYIDVTGRRMKLHLNFLDEKILMTVVKGKVLFRGYEYESDCKRQVEIHDYDLIFAEDVQLQFFRRRER